MVIDRADTAGRGLLAGDCQGSGVLHLAQSSAPQLPVSLGAETARRAR